jgi:hypothetical protein
MDIVYAAGSATALEIERGWQAPTYSAVRGTLRFSSRKSASARRRRHPLRL